MRSEPIRGSVGFAHLLSASFWTRRYRVSVLTSSKKNIISVKRFHLIFGLLLFVIFLLTGQYMDRVHNHLQGMPDGPRILYRTRHIFILLSALLHVGIGSYFKYRREKVRRVLQLLGSLLITVAPILFIIGFFREPYLTGLYAPLSKKGIILIAIGTLLHLLSAIPEPEPLKTD